MTDRLLRIVITPEEIDPDEPRRIISLLDAGWDFVHLRHPAASIVDVRKLIEAIPQKYHSRLRLHGHFQLAAEFNLGGLHLNGRCPAAPAFYSGHISRSCHSLEELRSHPECDYATLSPIFNSISKPGYNAAFSPADLAKVNEIHSPIVVALGGVTPDRIGLIARMGFGGYAVKGAIDLFQ